MKMKDLVLVLELSTIATDSLGVVMGERRTGEQSQGRTESGKVSASSHPKSPGMQSGSCVLEFKVLVPLGLLVLMTGPRKKLPQFEFQT